MTCNLNLQRNTKVFFSTQDIAGGAAVNTITPANTWKIEVMAGYAVSQSAATQDITTLESGTSPDRSTTRFNTSINPTEWNFDTYLRPSGAISTDVSATGNHSGNVMPVADWFLWQALIGNTAYATGSRLQSSWEAGGIYRSETRSAAANVASQRSNFSEATQYHLYMVLDNVFYQVANAAVGQASVDASIDQIAKTTWTGQGTDLIELTGTVRNNAVSVFGGTLNNGSSVTANSSAANTSLIAAYHPWASMNVGGTVTSASFIKNRLSTIDIFHTDSSSVVSNYTFPVTALTWSYNNNITYLTPEELAVLNAPIGNFTGSRQISGNFSAYLRHGANNSAQFLRNIVEDTRTQHTANANLRIGGATAPFVAFSMPQVHFSFPTHAIEDVVAISVDFMAEESTAGCGTGNEVTIFARK